MSIKAIVRELREIRDGVGDKSRPGSDGRYWHCRMRSPIAPDQAPISLSVEQCQWANLPQELLLDIIRRVEASETSWPARAVVIFCASVCRSWREVTKGIVKALEECGRLTFPISLKQPGPRACPIQCFIRRDRTTSRYFLYYGLVPSEYDRDKLLLAARKIRRATSKDFVISLATDDFSRASNTYVGKIRSNFLGTKFTIYDSQPPCDAAATQPISRSSRRFHSKQVSPRVPACNYSTGTVSYELNVLRTRGPRRMHCVMNSIPFSSIREGGTVPTPTSSLDQPSPLPLTTKGNEPSKELIGKTKEPLVLKNKSPRWHEQLQCWCLNFRGRVTVASVKNFQLVADCDPSQNIPVSEQEKVILQFGKIGKDIFTMDYRYPLSAFQAFAIALSSFDTKPACE